MRKLILHFRLRRIGLRSGAKPIRRHDAGYEARTRSTDNPSSFSAVCRPLFQGDPSTPTGISIRHRLRSSVPDGHRRHPENFFDRTCRQRAYSFVFMTTEMPVVMLYAILCYHDEDVVGSWTKEQDDAVMAKLAVVQDKLAKQGRLGPVARLLPTTAATTLRKDDPPLVLDGPLPRPRSSCSASTSSTARTSTRRSTSRAISARPIPAAPMRSARSACSRPGSVPSVTDTAWIDAALTSARPQAVGALLRYFRDLDTAEEAFQDACLRALKTWPQNGPPRDPAAWLIMVGRNVAIDDVRRSAQAAAAARRGRDLRSRRRRGRDSPSGSTARTTATTSCGCCSSAAIRTCRRRSRSRWRCASSPA